MQPNTKLTVLTVVVVYVNIAASLLKATTVKPAERPIARE
jgi:hypothetical protein